MPAPRRTGEGRGLYRRHGSRRGVRDVVRRQGRAGRIETRPQHNEHDTANGGERYLYKIFTFLFFESDGIFIEIIPLETL